MTTLYEQADIPEGMTLRQWRADRHPCPRRRRWLRHFRRALRTAWQS